MGDCGEFWSSPPPDYAKLYANPHNFFIGIHGKHVGDIKNQ